MVDTTLNNAHSLEGHQVLRAYEVDRSTGLSTTEVEARQLKFGRNQLKERPAVSFLELVRQQFEDLLVRILLGAAVVSFVLAYLEEHEESSWTNYVEPLVILLILFANACVGVWQESNAEQALEALKKLQPLHATVLRDGRIQVIDAEDLVPGDLAEVSVGDRVPADIRVLELKTVTLNANQSSLTGESEDVFKDSLPIQEDADLVAQNNMLFASTAIPKGSCWGVVVKTGMETQIGLIQAAVLEAEEEEEPTPLQLKIEEFGNQLAKVIFVVCILVWAINYQHFFDPIHGSVFRGCVYYFKIAVALAVAAIPEGLPAVITTSLALGTRRMAKRNAIVRKIKSVQTLGCTTVICTDKTGTLTTNQMTVVNFQLAGQNQLSVTSMEEDGSAPATLPDSRAFTDFVKIALTCNTSEANASGEAVAQGSPTEAALLHMAHGLLGAFQKTSRENQDKDLSTTLKTLQKVATLEFDRERKSMSVLIREAPDAPNSLVCKGAPEYVLDRCSHFQSSTGEPLVMNPQMRETILQSIQEMGQSAFRGLALAQKTDLHPSLQAYDGSRGHPGHAILTDLSQHKVIESEMTFVGLVSIRDPPRPECGEAIRLCRQAGVSVVMITGDNKETAEAIGRELGIISEPQDANHVVSFTGAAFEKLPPADQRDVFENLESNGLIFSRTEPRHKQTIVRVMRQLGHVVAMTGDGVNDAPALKQADIGIAMGIAGTEVAKEASDMVLADDNFSTIVAAIEEGRSIYNNMKAFIRYLISSNIGEVASIFLTAALGIPEAMVPVQLLWVNLVTDGLPATALGFNPPDLDVMSKAPRGKNESLISSWVFFRYLVIGAYVGLSTVGIFVYWFVFDTDNGHSTISFNQLTTFGECATWSNFDPFVMDTYSNSMVPLSHPCAFFDLGKQKASTLSLTVLVMVEMFNALNALSEDGSLWHVPPSRNPYLILAILLSVVVHFAVLYLSFLRRIFNVVALDAWDWQLVLLFSVPVIFLDELLKACGRQLHASQSHRLKQD